MKEADAARLRAIWLYREQDETTRAADAEDAAPEDELHPDHRIG